MIEILPATRFYVYTLAYPDGKVFYVGKGTGDRINLHERHARQGSEKRRCVTIRQIWAQGGKVLKAKIHEGLEEKEAYEREKYLIEEYGLENLTNEAADGKPKPGGSGYAVISDGTANQLRPLAASLGFKIRRGVGLGEGNIGAMMAGIAEAYQSDPEVVAELVMQILDKRASVREVVEQIKKDGAIIL